MYEEIIEYVKKDDFSPTIFSNFMDSLFIFDYNAEENIKVILANQGKAEIAELDYSKLTLKEIFSVLTNIYQQAYNLVYPSMMYKTGNLAKIMDRLQELDHAPKNKGFDDRKYLYLRNLIIKATTASAFTKHRVIIEYSGLLWFYIDNKALERADVQINYLDEIELHKYMEALMKNGWIFTFEPEYDAKWIVYPDKRLQKLIGE